jgi:shikimate kinase
MSLCLPPRLALVGLRGAGKTVVGRLVAERTGFAFIDLDERIAEAAGAGHSGEVIERFGLAAFRELEEEHLARSLSEPHRVVLSTGGGAVESPSSRRLLRTAAVTIWLRAPLEVLLRRVAADEENDGAAPLRPSILAAEGHTEGRSGRAGGVSADEEFRLLSERRAPLYREVARRAIDTSAMNPLAVARQAAQIWFG